MIRIAFFLYCFAALLSSAAFAADAFLVDSNNVTLAAPGGRVPLHIALTGAAAPASITVTLSPFSGDQGLLNVAIAGHDCSVGGAAGTSATLTPAASHIAAACLVVSGSAPGAKYAGTLIISADVASAGVAEFHPLTINAAAAAVPALALDHQAETKQFARPWWTLFGAGYSTPVDSVTVVEKSGKNSASGISVRLEQGAKSPSGFDDKLNLSFASQGKPVDEFIQTPATADPLRTIAAASQGRFEVSVRDLDSGEYTIPLRFSGTNTGPDTPQNLLTLTVRVRDSVWGAIICLLVALLASLIVTKFLSGLQRRAQLRQQIRDMEKARSADPSSSPPAVWVNAMLHLADELTSGYWLTGADLIDARVSSIRAMIGLLNQASDLRAALSSKLSPLARRRALQVLDGLLSKLNVATADSAKIDAAKAQLTSLNDWLKADTLSRMFWSTIQPALQELQREVPLWSVPESALARVNDLVTELDKALKGPQDASFDVEKAYADYMRLRLLYDHRDNLDLVKQLIEAQADLDQCFKISDEVDWARLEKAELTIQLPNPPAGENLEAYDPLSFSVVSKDPKVADSFLFRHQVEFAWTFTLTDSKVPAPIELKPKAFGPWITQYFPRPGQVKAGVTLTYGGKTKTIDPQAGPAIEATTDFGTFKAFATIDYVAWGFAGVVALLTGLSSVYLKNATFGSMQDYILLFLWGIGADQGKNLAQALQTYTPASPAGK